MSEVKKLLITFSEGNKVTIVDSLVRLNNLLRLQRVLITEIFVRLGGVESLASLMINWIKCTEIQGECCLLARSLAARKWLLCTEDCLLHW